MKFNWKAAGIIGVTCLICYGFFLKSSEKQILEETGSSRGRSLASLKKEAPAQRNHPVHDHQHDQDSGEPLLKNYDDKLTEKGEALLRDRVNDKLESLEKDLIRKEELLQAGLGPEADDYELQQGDFAPTSFAFTEEPVLGPSVAEVDPSLERSISIELRQKLGRYPSKEEVLAEIESFDSKVEEANRKLEDSHSELAVAFKSSDPEQMEIMRAKAASGSSVVERGPGDELSNLSPEEKSEVERKMMITLLNKEAEALEE